MWTLLCGTVNIYKVTAELDFFYYKYEVAYDKHWQKQGKDKEDYVSDDFARFCLWHLF